MSGLLLARIPGTQEWIRATFTPRVELKLRKELRALERATEARAVVLWFAAGGEVIAFSGDRSAIPRRTPYMEGTVPTFEDFVLERGERIAAVVQVVQLGKALPMLRVAAIAPGPFESTRLFEAIEHCAERLEEVVVATI